MADSEALVRSCGGSLSTLECVFSFLFVFFLFCLFLNAKVSGVLLDLACTLLISLMLATNANANFGKQTLFIQFQRKL